MNGTIKDAVIVLIGLLATEGAKRVWGWLEEKFETEGVDLRSKLSHIG